MSSHRLNRKSLHALLLLAVVWCAGCAVAIGPGYSISRQEIKTEFVATAAPRVHVDAVYDLLNNGYRPLKTLELVLPPKRFHAESVNVTWDGAPLALAVSLHNPRASLLTLPSEWKVNDHHTVHLTYDIISAPQGEPGLTFAEDAFFLPEQGWTAEFLPSRGAFAFGGTPPARWTFSVNVPEGFVVHMSGENSQTQKISGRIIVSASQRLQDLYPFVVAGRYAETVLKESKQTITLWTRTPQQAANLDQAKNSLSRIFQAYDQLFGEQDKKAVSDFWVVECPVVEGCLERHGGNYLRLIGSDQQSSAEMVSLDTALAGFSGDVTSSVDALAGPALAASWLGFGRNPGFRELEPPLTALPLFAAATARESIDGPGTRQKIVQRALAQIPEGLPVRQPDSPEAQRAKNLLFFYALRETYGDKAFHDALHHMLNARSGRGIILADLIAAMEQETHANVVEFTRHWIKRNGVPPEFRAKFAVVPNASAVEVSQETKP